MALVDSPGTVIVPTSDIGRYMAFWVCLNRLQQPAGTQVAITQGSNISSNLNGALRSMKGDWVQIWGDDHTFSPGLLLNLLRRLDEHPEAGILLPLCLRRRGSFHTPLGVEWWQGDSGEMEILPLALVPDPATGLFEISQAGLPGAVIRREVLEAVGDPWFEWNTIYDLTRGVGKIQLRMGEDFYFCRKVKEKGFKIFVDLAQTIGHIISPTTVPRWSPAQKRWVIDIVLDGVTISTVAPTVKLIEERNTP